MFDKKTVLVIGAGASQEAKLPTGAGIKKQIADFLHLELNAFGRPLGDPIITGALLQHLGQQIGPPPDLQPYARAAEAIRNAMPQAISIDHFIDAHNGDDKIELCSKLAIVRSILKAERDSLLYVDTSNKKYRPNYEKLSDTLVQ